MRFKYGQYVFLLPIITNVWVIVGFSSTFAMTYNASMPDFPYISYTGVGIPERGFFTIVTAVAAAMVAVNLTIRYRFLTQFRIITQHKYWNIVNKVCLGVGFVMTFGLLMVGCFQVDSMQTLHYTGAFACFSLALVYAFVQSILTYNLKDGQRSKGHVLATSCNWQYVFIWQLANSLLSVIFFMSFALGHGIYESQKKKNIGTKFDILRGIYLCASISEWLLALSVISFLLTYIPNFKQISGLKVNVKLSHKRTADENNIQDAQIESVCLQEKEAVS